MAKVFLCPNCSGEFTHIDSVVGENQHEAFRMVATGEDDDARLRVTNPREIIARPVGRRHQFVLEGWCEGCPNRFQVIYHQMKGHTVYAEVVLNA